MKIYLVDGRTGEVEFSEKALVALSNAAKNHRLGMPTQIKVGGHFEIVSISAIDLDRTLNQPKTLVMQLPLPGVKP